jgi:hypothetical protein
LMTLFFTPSSVISIRTPLADLEIVVDPGSPTPNDNLGWQKLSD